MTTEEKELQDLKLENAKNFVSITTTQKEIVRDLSTLTMEVKYLTKTMAINENLQTDLGVVKDYIEICKTTKNKVDLMWRAFIGVVGLVGVTIIGTILHQVIKG